MVRMTCPNCKRIAGIIDESADGPMDLYALATIIGLIRKLATEQGAEPQPSGELIQKQAAQLVRAGLDLAIAKRDRQILERRLGEQEAEIALLHATEQAEGQQGETAWLIELPASTSDENRARWWRGRDVPGPDQWTSDPNDVVRFARKEDAERMRKLLSVEHLCIVTEHAWYPVPTTEGAPTESEGQGEPTCHAIFMVPMPEGYSKPMGQCGRPASDFIHDPRAQSVSRHMFVPNPIIATEDAASSSKHASNS